MAAEQQDDALMKVVRTYRRVWRNGQPGGIGKTQIIGTCFERNGIGIQFREVPDGPAASGTPR